jgi:hypothetical protein
MSDSTSNAAPARGRSGTGRWIALALFDMAATPLIAAYVANFYWKPTRGTNYGTLIAQTSVSDARLTAPSGQQFSLADLKGKWLLVQIGGGQCDEECATRQFIMRQVRLMQGREASRVERVWIIIDQTPADPRIVSAYEGLKIGRADPRAVLPSFPAPDDPSEHIYVVDPLGNVVMRFPARPDPAGMNRDLSRLLRVSHIG